MSFKRFPCGLSLDVFTGAIVGCALLYFIYYYDKIITLLLHYNFTYKQCTGYAMSGGGGHVTVDRVVGFVSMCTI